MASAMTYNELITAQREMKKMGKTFYTVDYKDLGIDWMDNVLSQRKTSSKNIRMSSRRW